MPFAAPLRGQGEAMGPCPSTRRITSSGRLWGIVAPFRVLPFSMTRMARYVQVIGGSVVSGKRGGCPLDGCSVGQGDRT
jgi:hypothetical protein